MGAVEVLPKVPKGFWDSLDNQKQFIEQVAAEKSVDVTELIDADLLNNRGLFVVGVNIL